MSIAFNNGETPCKDWLAAYSMRLSILYGVAVFISLLNAVLRVLLRLMSAKEAAHTRTDQLSSASTKMWVVQFFNSALILLLINGKQEGIFSVPNNSPILAGKYSDFTAEWYGAVGATIALTCFFNTVMPWTNMMFYLMAGVKRHMDRNYTFDLRKTKKVLQQEYEQLYLGSVF